MVRVLDFNRRARDAQRALATSGPQPQEFVRQAFDVDRTNARHVALARVVPTRKGWRTVTITKIPGQRARHHEQLWYPPDQYRGSFRACRGMRFDCDCGRLTYVFNWVHVDRGLAVYDRTNDQPPDVTNPGRQPGICKHGVVTARYLLRDNPSFPHELRVPGSSDPVTLTTLRTRR